MIDINTCPFCNNPSETVHYPKDYYEETWGNKTAIYCLTNTCGAHIYLDSLNDELQFAKFITSLTDPLTGFLISWLDVLINHENNYNIFNNLTNQTSYLITDNRHYEHVIHLLVVEYKKQQKLLNLL